METKTITIAAVIVAATAGNGNSSLSHLKCYGGT